jgi:TolB-like protein/class 3 adenylate cyclase
MAEGRAERRLAAIVQADVVGYSRLIGLDEEGTLARLSTHRTEWIDPKIAEHRGRIVKTMGDGLLLEFPSVVNATRCAVDIQRGMADRNAGLGDDRRIEFRIGVHLGDVVVADGDIYGDGVNIAARLEALAEPGGICLSRAARDQVLDRLDFPLKDLGEIKVKNIARPVQVFKAVLGGRAAPAGRKPSTRSYRYGTAALIAIVVAFYSYDVWFGNDLADVEPAAMARMVHALPEKPSVAVLPFDNLSGDKEQDYFADGMVEDLITDLSKVSGLFVISRNSTFFYKGRAVKVRQVAEDLGVRYVVEGGVRRSGDTLRINVQVIDALSGRQVWADRYDGARADVFDLQDRITAKIVAALAVKLVSGKVRAAQGTDHPAAYDAVLSGWKHLRLADDDPGNYVLARERFENALRLDPDYSRAHLSLAAAWWWSAQKGEYMRMGVTTYAEGLRGAEIHLKTAMKTPTPLSHRIQAEMYRDIGRYDQAIAEARRAVALDPNNPEGYGALAAAQIFAGRLNDGMKNLETADRLDPKNPRPNWIRRGIANLLLGNHGEAARFFELSVAARPNFVWTYRWLISAYGHLGRKPEARAAIDKMNWLRMANGYRPVTMEDAGISSRLGRESDKNTFLQGLKKAGLPKGPNAETEKWSPNSIISKTDQGTTMYEGPRR